MKIGRWAAVISVLVLLIMPAGCGTEKASSTEMETRITLPEPVYDSDTSLEATLLNRRSVRDYTEEPVTLPQLSQLLWAGQGITSPSGFRTAPSAGGLYPLKLYVVAGNVAGMPAGIYEYEPETHTLKKIKDGDQRQSLMQVVLNQKWVGQAAVDIVLTAVYEITTVKYGERGIRYVHIEAGHAAQNICLEVVALKLGAVTVGAFDDVGIQGLIGLPEDEVPLYVIPVGNPID